MYLYSLQIKGDSNKNKKKYTCYDDPHQEVISVKDLFDRKLRENFWLQFRGPGSIPGANRFSEK
jgi:hypothetical protein